MLTAVLLAASGILTAAESFSGFSSNAVIIIISVFILAEGLARAGVSESVARLILRLGGKGKVPCGPFHGGGGCCPL